MHDLGSCRTVVTIVGSERFATHFLYSGSALPFEKRVELIALHTGGPMSDIDHLYRIAFLPHVLVLHLSFVSKPAAAHHAGCHGWLLAGCWQVFSITFQSGCPSNSVMCHHH